MSTRQAAAKEAGELVDVLAAAFHDDPVFGWMMPDPARRQPGLKRFFAIELDSIVFPQGVVWTTEERDGAALCLPPGRWRMPPRELLAHGPAYARIFGRRLAHATTLLTRMEGRHHREPHYYIPYIGVRPGRQGRGIGSELLLPILEQCDQEGLPAYLEATCERNAKLYARHGFERLKELRVLGSPPLLPMLRAPG